MLSLQLNQGPMPATKGGEGPPVLAFVLALKKEHADAIVDKFDQQVLNDKCIMACPYYLVSTDFILEN